MERVGHMAKEMATGQAPDDDLAVASRTDAAAFETLYDRHHLAIYRYLRGRASGGEDAADLTALTFERALVSIGSFYPGRSAVRPHRRVSPTAGQRPAGPGNGPGWVVFVRRRPG